jgi:hypothetical protein
MISPAEVVRRSEQFKNMDAMEETIIMKQRHPRLVHRAGLAVLMLTGMTSVYAQQTAAVPITVSAGDYAAAAAAVPGHIHARSALGTNQRTAAAGGLESLSSAQQKSVASVQNLTTQGGIAVRYPGDLFYMGGPTVGAEQSHAIYVNPNSGCPAPSCWGNPEQFLKDLGSSNFIHLTDQYTGLTSSHRYTLGTHFVASVSPVPTPAYTGNDMVAIVHAAASIAGTGYGHIYHIFLTPGTDECFDNTFTVCYSPDNTASWYFCAYHGSVDFPDIGHVLFSVEPYQNVPGCWDEVGTPNGRVVDSTNDTLSHELFETITDPDGTGWWQYYGGGMSGEEIGDECAFASHNGDGSSVPFTFSMGRNVYATQPEYSNSAHGCTVQPSD